MIKVILYQNKNVKNTQAYGKWYPRPVIEETIGLEQLAEHMAKHNTPFSAGAIKGILTDAVNCTRELILDGKNVKFPDLAIFSVGLIVNGGADSEEEFSLTKNIRGVRLRSRATGRLTSAKLGIEAVVRRAKDVGTSGTIEVPGSSDTDQDGSGSSGSTSGGTGSSTGGSGSSSGGSTPGGDDGDEGVGI